LCARKAALLAAAPGDRPGKARFDRRCGGIDVVPIEAKPGLEAKRIAGAEPNQLHLRLDDEALDDRSHPQRLDGNFVAVLTGIARAADVTFDTVKSRA
jgi:hypothetical protein